MEILSFDSADNNKDLDPRRPEDFARLVELTHSDLLVYATALSKSPTTARDIVQDAFVVAYEKIDLFDVTRDFPTWMRGIVRNKWREWIRKNKRYDLGEPELARLDADIANWQARQAEGKSSLLDALEQCLDRLPENLKETIHAFYFEGRSGEETSELLNIAPAAVRKRLQRARVLLKNCLDTKLESPSEPSN